MRSLWLTVARGVSTTRSSMYFIGLDHGFTLTIRPLCLGPEKPGRSRSPRLSAPGRLEGVGSVWSGRLHLRPTDWRPRWCPGLQPQVSEDLLDYRLLQDRHDDLQLAATVRAVLGFPFRVARNSDYPPSQCQTRRPVNLAPRRGRFAPAASSVRKYLCLARAQHGHALALGGCLM